MFRQKSVLFSLLAAVLVVVVACTSAIPTPTLVPPTPTPEPTPVPTNPILADPTTETLVFLDALPESERDCALEVIGDIERAVGLLQQDHDVAPLTPAEVDVIGLCFSDETVQRVIIGQLDREAGGLSDSTVSCIEEQSVGLSAAALFTSEPEIDSSISLIKSIFCLNHEEREAVSSGDNAYGFSDLGGIDALECVVNGAGPTGLEGLMGALSMTDPDAGFDTLTELFPIMVECGAIDDSNFEGSGVTAEQIGCLLNEMGEGSLALLDPEAELDIDDLLAVLPAFEECDIDIEDLMDGAMLPVDPDAMVDPDVPGDSDDPVIIDPDAIDLPTDLDDAELPFTDEQIACLLTELGEEKVADLLAGGTPDLSLFAALTTCGIDVMELLAP